MGILDEFLPRLLRPSPPIRTGSELASFMDARAAFLSQKGIVEFCRVRAGVYWQKLFSEAEFQTALDLARWRAYPPCYAMVAEMVEGALRSDAGIERRRLPAALEALARTSFAGYPIPAGAQEDFWEEAVELVRERLAATQARAPRPVRELPDPLARRVFESLPIHPDLLTNDYDYIFNFLRMNLLRAHEDLLKLADRPSLVRELLGSGGS